MKAARTLVERSLDNPRHRRAFRRWLEGNGAEILDPTNPYELIRFRGSAGISIVYRDNRGRHSLTGQAQEAWDAFSAGDEMDLSQLSSAHINDPDKRVPSMSDAALVAEAARQPVTIAFLMGHDQLPMREAAQRLFGMERAGLLVRVPVERGSDALLWSAR